MGRLSFLRRLFGGGSARSANGGVYVRVKCSACGEVIQARINPTSELSQAEDAQGYFVRKVLIGRQCFRPIEVQLWYSDLGKTEVNREVKGGTSVE